MINLHLARSHYVLGLFDKYLTRVVPCDLHKHKMIFHEPKHCSHYWASDVKWRVPRFPLCLKKVDNDCWDQQMFLTENEMFHLSQLRAMFYMIYGWYFKEWKCYLPMTNIFTLLKRCSIFLSGTYSFNQLWMDIGEVDKKSLRHSVFPGGHPSKY